MLIQINIFGSYFLKISSVSLPLQAFSQTENLENMYMASQPLKLSVVKDISANMIFVLLVTLGFITHACMYVCRYIPSSWDSQYMALIMLRISGVMSGFYANEEADMLMRRLVSGPPRQLQERAWSRERPRHSQNVVLLDLPDFSGEEKG